MPYNKTSPLANLPRLRDVMTKRASSWDRTGGNRDFIVVQPGASATLADIRGAGCINHVWCTMASPEVTSTRCRPSQRRAWTVQGSG